jgi:hypothetical protein
VFIVDCSAGDPLPAGGLVFSGGAGQNTLEIIGTSGNDTATVNGSAITLAAPFGTLAVTYTGANIITFDGDATGSDTLIQAAQPGGGANLLFSRPTAQDSLDISAGSFTFAADNPGAGTLAYNLGTLSIAAGANVALATSDSLADQTVLTAANLAIAGSLDIANNMLLASETSVPLAQVAALVTNSGLGAQITSSLVTGPGAIPDRAVGFGDSIVDAGIVPTGDVEVRYTVAGDVNLDGVVNSADYTRAVNSFNQTVGYPGGDILNHGKVDVADIAIITNDFNAGLNANGAGASGAATTSGSSTSVGAAAAPSTQATPPKQKSSAAAVTLPAVEMPANEIFSTTPINADWLKSSHKIL